MRLRKELVHASWSSNMLSVTYSKRQTQQHDFAKKQTHALASMMRYAID